MRDRKAITELDRRGFTAVELLATLGLSGLLMLAVLSVTSSLASDLTPAGSGIDRAWIDRTINLIERDLLHAKQFDTGEGRLDILGYTRHDRIEQAWSHRPVRITYAIEHNAGAPTLVRTQQGYDTNAIAIDRQVMAFGVGGFRIEPEPTEPHPQTSPGDTDDSSPSEIRLSLRLEDGRTIQRRLSAR